MLILPDPADSTPSDPAEFARVCRRCNRGLPLSEFYVYGRDNRPYSRCKDCSRVQSAECARARRARGGAKAERRKAAPKPPRPAPKTTKVCRGCGVELPLPAYYSPKGRKYCRCYACVLAKNAQTPKELQAQYRRNSSAKCKERRKSDPGFIKRERAHKKKYIDSHPHLGAVRRERVRQAYRFDLGFRTKTLAGVRKYRENNPQKVTATTKKEYQKNKHRYLAKNNNRRARKRGSGGTHTAEQWESLKDQFGRRCLRCDRAEPAIRLTRDHIIPISRGGSNDISNIQPLCLGCNLKKGVRTFDYRPAVQAHSSGMLPFMD